MPNLPIEDDLDLKLYSLQFAAETHHIEWKKGKITRKEYLQKLKEERDYLTKHCIHHYTTKRELEARIDEAYMIKHLLNTSHHDLPIDTPASYTAGVIEQRVVELKAQKEQENKS